jgi:hypothetical protein
MNPAKYTPKFAALAEYLDNNKRHQKIITVWHLYIAQISTACDADFLQWRPGSTFGKP